jgi:hypothetical protein
MISTPTKKGLMIKGTPPGKKTLKKDIPWTDKPIINVPQKNKLESKKVTCIELVIV